MAALSHRERITKALNHEEADRVPRDLGQAIATGINTEAYNRLVKHLGLEAEAAGTEIDHQSQVALPCEALLQRFDIDCRGLFVGRPSKALTENSYVDEWGVFWSKPEEGGHFIFRDGPFQKTDPTLAEVEAHPWPNPKDPERVKGLREQAQKLRDETDYAIVLRLPYGTVYDCQKIRGFAQFLEDLVINPALAEALMEHSLMVELGIVELALEAIGEYVDVVCFPDDLGFQDRPYVRPELYRKMIKPYHRRTVETIRSNTKAKVLMHTDGAVYPLIPDFIDIGVDILNPVQISAKDMEARRLKTEFGADISFWGGIDTHRVLPTGTPAEVRNEVKERIEDFAPGGGFVLGSVHNILAEVPAENVVVMFDSALEYGNYR